MVEQLLKIMVVHIQHHIGIHLDEPAVAVIGKARIAGAVRQRHHGFIIQAKIEHRVHHARHRGAGTRAHRHQQRIACIAKGASCQRADMRQGGLDLRLQLGGILTAMSIKGRTHFGSDGKTGGNRQAQIGHFRQIGTLATEQIFHARRTLSLAVTKCIDPLRHIEVP